MTEPKSESIKEIADYLDVKYKIGLLWENFTREKRNDEWYKMNDKMCSRIDSTQHYFDPLDTGSYYETH